MVTKTVIDTNVLVAALSSKSVHHWLITLLFNEKFELYVTDDIMLEYEEILKVKYSETVATNFLIALQELPNVYFIKVYYRWNLISDMDDNKFVDCYVAAGARFLISHDNHFSVLKTITFPQVNLVKLEEFGRDIGAI